MRLGVPVPILTNDANDFITNPQVRDEYVKFFSNNNDYSGQSRINFWWNSDKCLDKFAQNKTSGNCFDRDFLATCGDFNKKGADSFCSSFSHASTVWVRKGQNRFSCDRTTYPICRNPTRLKKLRIETNQYQTLKI